MADKAIDISKYGSVENTSMTVELINDAMLASNFLTEVTNPISFNKTIATSDGLFSEVIFGSTPEEKSKTLGYINLGGKFFHPYAWEVLLRLNRKFDDVARGNGMWEVKDGVLTKLPEDKDNWELNNTGLQWLIDNFSKIDLTKSDSKSYIRAERVKFIKGCIEKNSLFISKYVVIPLAYRDIERNNTSVGKIKKPEISQMYENLLKYSQAMKVDSIGFVNNNLSYMIESSLVALRKLGQSLIHKKNGFFHKSVLGKNQDYGARSVISTPVLSDVLKPSDNPVNMLHAGIPLSQCISMGFPFIMKYISDFFRKEFETAGVNYPVYKRNKETGKMELNHVKLDNPMEFYNNEYIKKQMKKYINFYESRFYPIEIPVGDPDGNKYYMAAVGKITPADEFNPLNSSISNRPFTWTDLLYIAAAESLKDKHVIITRYPVSNYLGSHPNKIHVLSTLRTFPVMIGGELYPYYPIINYGADDIDTLFIDTVTMSNAYLKALGGDYDGDTVSAKMVYTEEANEELNNLLYSYKHYFTLKGDLIRTLGNEVYLTFYNMSIY